MMKTNPVAELPLFKPGQDVTVYSGMTGKPYTTVTAQVERVSPLGLVVTVKRSDYRVPSRFYVNASGTRFVQNPGAGIGGALHNDYIRADKVDV